MADAFAAIGLLALTGLYVSNPAFGNPAEQTCAAAKRIAAKIAPLALGEVAAIAVAEDPKPLADLTFTGPDGSRINLSDFRGRTVLLNLWATWCVPCRLEMPALDKLQAELGGNDFVVVAVNIDTRNPERPKQFLKETNISALTFYTDVSARIYQDLKAAGYAFGMPTTMLIDKQGCALGSMAGPAEWSGKDSLALIKASLDQN